MKRLGNRIGFAFVCLIIFSIFGFADTNVSGIIDKDTNGREMGSRSYADTGSNATTQVSATPTAGVSWIISTIDSTGDVGKHTSIAVDANEKVHISYFDFTNGKLKYTTNATGSWVTSIVDSASDYDSGIALDANGKVHIVYDGTGGDLKYATNATGSWVISTVEIGAYSGVTGDDSIAIDSNGKVHISYFKASGLDLKYATNASGTWSTSIVVNGGATGPLPGYSASIGVDSNNKIHISYYDDASPDSIKYVTNISGSWVVTTISTIGFAAGWKTSLAVDSNNKAHISYYNYTNDALKYASNASGTWQTEIVDDSSGGVWDASLAIDKINGNQVHLVYGSYYGISYAKKSAGTWQISRIDASCTGSYNSIAIGSSSIHISYYDGYNLNLKYASLSIVAAPTVTVTSPNGGESWLVGSTHNITWTTTGTIANVKIEYSTNNGTAWTTITASTSNTGAYPWTVPGTVSSSCLVRVSEAQTGTPTDTSNTVFSIVEHLTIKLSGRVSEDVPSPVLTRYLAGIKIEFSGGMGTAVTDTNGSFSKDVPYGWTGTVTPSDPNDSTATFVPQDRKYTNILEDQAGQNYRAVYQPVKLEISKSSLFFGVSSSGAKTKAQPILVTNAGGRGPVGFTTFGVFKHASWISAKPITGITNTQIQVDVDPTGLGPGSYEGYVIFEYGDQRSDWSSATLQVTLNILQSSVTPFGSFDTPINGTTGITGAIPVTGWVLDDIETTKVEIWRDPVWGEGPGLVFIGNGVFVEGARPDVEQSFTDYPLNYRAGWGYMLLTNFLPNKGNGNFKLHAFAYDREGHQTLLGSRSISCDNANGIKPVGALDTPYPGEEISGNNYVNFGWVVTPQPKEIPKDGSTITVWVDSKKLGNPVYNQYRKDVADYFPGLKNSDGAVGYFNLDTTKYSNGVHTIHWIATDDQGAADGIGSRYFNIFNTGTAAQISSQSINLEKADSYESVMNLPVSFEPGKIKRGFSLKTEPEVLQPDNYGVISIEIKEVERVEVDLGKGRAYRGYLVVGEELRSLPMGTTLDQRTGTFSWMPGPGFLGTYDLLFLQTDEFGITRRIPIKATIKPKYEKQ